MADQTDTVAVRIAWDPITPSNTGKVKQLAPDEARRLVRDGRAAYLTDTEPAEQRRTVEEVLADVGDDPAKAREALDAEQAHADPRKSLVKKLTALTQVSHEPAAFGQPGADQHTD